MTEHTWMPHHGICECGSTDKNHPDHVADVLIRELNLATACKSGCMWQIPDKIEDMTPKQRQALDMDKCYISGCTCGKPKYERQSPAGQPDPPGAWKARLDWPEGDCR